MFIKDNYKEKVVSSGFGQDRGSYKHAGVDYPGTKKDVIVNQIAGVVEKIVYNDKYFGTHCVVYSNPKFAKGIEEVFYHEYCHLSEVSSDLAPGKFIDAGAYIGKMGNTGDCYTSYDANGKITHSYRLITVQEQNDPECFFGVHLHLGFYQFCQAGKKTKLINEMKNKKIISDNTMGDTHFYQWQRVYFAPRVIYSYFKIIENI